MAFNTEDDILKVLSFGWRAQLIGWDLTIIWSGDVKSRSDALKTLDEQTSLLRDSKKKHELFEGLNKVLNTTDNFWELQYQCAKYIGESLPLLGKVHKYPPTRVNGPSFQITFCLKSSRGWPSAFFCFYREIGPMQKFYVFNAAC